MSDLVSKLEIFRQSMMATNPLPQCSKHWLEGRDAAVVGKHRYECPYEEVTGERFKRSAWLRGFDTIPKPKLDVPE